MNEFQLIKKFFKPLTKTHEAARNLADDVAKISLKKNEELVISKDLIVEDVHFLRSDGGFKIASKLLRVNLSDLAAAGATPLHYLLGFSKNKNTDAKFCAEFARGLKSVQDEFGLCLIGGDTVSSEKLFFSVTIFGVVKKGKILSRGNAKDGDLIFVSGSIGDAGLGLKIKTHEILAAPSATKDDVILERRHFFPTPRISLGKKLLEKNLSHCAIDVSDGLLADLRHICQSSKLAAEIYFDRIPISSAAKNFLKKNPKKNPLDLLSSGDDYELIFTTNPKNEKKISALAKNLKLDLTCIGKLTKAVGKNSTVILRDTNNRKITIKKFGYEH
jgi:thiamine-monophosphate kinase